MSSRYPDMECPYCGHDFDLDHDDGAYYDEGQEERCECPECGKQFMVRSWCTWNHEGERADCLNGDADHEWRKKYPNADHWPALKEQEECFVCGEHRTVKEYTSTTE